MIHRMIVCRAVSHGASLGEWGTYGHDERISKTRGAVSDLVAELDVVVVEPSTRDYGDAVKACNAALGKEAGENVADDAADSMGGKDLTKHVCCELMAQKRRRQHTHIETVVVAEQELELRGEVAHSACHETEENGSSC